MRLQSPLRARPHEYWIGYSAECGILIGDDEVYQPELDTILLWSYQAAEMRAFAKLALGTSILSYSTMKTAKTGDEIRHLDDEAMLALHNYEGWLTKELYNLGPYHHVCWNHKECGQVVDDQISKRCPTCRLFRCDRGDCYCNAPKHVRDGIDRALANKRPPDAIMYIAARDGSEPPAS